MSRAVSLAIDAMGGDSAPDVVLEGVDLALKDDPNLNIILCGSEDVVSGFSAVRDRCEAKIATQVIEMGEHPAEAVRKTKKDSSIVVGCKLVKEGIAEGFFSAGSTGACLAAATLVIGRIKGIKRPALGVILPSYDKPTLLLDVGANADCKPEYLVQFANMGSAYAQGVMGVPNPSVGLLNIGEEETKGSIFAQNAFALLKGEVASFAGNCEGGDLMQGKFDVVVTDGFTGNVCLKTIEGSAKILFKYIKDAITSTPMAKIGAALVKGSLYELREKISPDAYGGSPLLGVKGACVIGHGSSSPEAIRNGIHMTARTVRADVCGIVEGMADEVALDRSSSEEA